MPGQKGQPRSLIVRIYRHGYSTLSGVVEDVASGAQEPFANLEELWEALKSMVRRKPRRRSKLPMTAGE